VAEWLPALVKLIGSRLKLMDLNKGFNILNFGNDQNMTFNYSYRDLISFVNL
jgi:hypothetical protein